VGRKEDAEDLVQITAEKALRAVNTPDDKTGYRKWLFRVLRNAFIDFYRNSVSKHNSGRSEDIEYFTANEAGIIEELAVRQGLERINPEHKEIICLVDIIGFSYREVSEIIGIPIGTVMSRLSRARKSLLEALNKNVSNKVLPFIKVVNHHE